MTIKPDLPPADEGFAWMPVYGAVYAGEGLARAPYGIWWHSELRNGGEAMGCLRLMRRLEPDEHPDTVASSSFRHSDGVWSEAAMRVLNRAVESPGAGWHAPVRFVPSHVPDFGQEGLRYLDPSEALCAALLGTPGEERFRVPITLPALGEQVVDAIYKAKTKKGAA